MTFTDREPTTEDLDRVSFSIRDLRELLDTLEDTQLEEDEREPLGTWIETLREVAKHSM